MDAYLKAEIISKLTFRHLKKHNEKYAETVDMNKVWQLKLIHEYPEYKNSEFSNDRIGYHWENKYINYMIQKVDRYIVDILSTRAAIIIQRDGTVDEYLRIYANRVAFNVEGKITPDKEDQRAFGLLNEPISYREYKRTLRYYIDKAQSDLATPIYHDNRLFVDNTDSWYISDSNITGHDILHILNKAKSLSANADLTYTLKFSFEKYAYVLHMIQHKY